MCSGKADKAYYFNPSIIYNAYMSGFAGDLEPISADFKWEAV